MDSGSMSGRSYHERPHVEEIHPKDRDLPGFTRDSRGRPKPGYHNPSTPGEASGMDTGIADVVGSAMYGHEHWHALKRRQRVHEKVKSAMRWVTSLGCLGVSALVMISAILGLVLLIRYLWGLL